MVIDIEIYASVPQLDVGLMVEHVILLGRLYSFELFCI